jgi:superfamily I DNA/RNA helicase
MTRWEAIRADARILRDELAAHGVPVNDIRNPESTARSAAGQIGLTVVPEHPDSANLRRAQAVLEDDIIYVDNSLATWRKAFAIAHEIGHARIHVRSAVCDASVIEPEGVSEDSDSSAEKAVGYGAGELREREANLFALELLLPCGAVRESFKAARSTADASAAGVPFGTFAGQMLRALLVPEPVRVEKERRKVTPDASQQAAATHRGSPLLVTAGPGTGKTQTLAERISFLLREGTAPARILALTFSKKAAEEMRERIAERHPEEARAIEVMTFHAFGLNVLRKYWQRAGLGPHSPLVDKIEALMHLEKNLARLGLGRLLSLSEPTRHLPEILSAISRAKDELCGPERFAELAAAQLSEARASEDERRIAQAERVSETAGVYRFYQDWLDTEKMLDFGDLIFRSVELLQRDSAVKNAVAGSYDAILVDEFQDVNRASGVLLREISGGGRGIWAVGDIRQSIYRWRGASPANIDRFSSDYDGAETRALEVNYRSLGGIVRAFSEFAGGMSAGRGSFRDWTAHRAEPDADVSLTVAPTIAEEAAAIAATALRTHGNGTEWRDQAVICRTNGQLVAFSDALERRGIPVFYLGDVFEREEVRDLLSLLDLSAKNNGHALVRVAEFPEYSIPKVDVVRVIEAAKTRDGGLAGVFADAEFDDELSDKGRHGWRLLRDHLAGLGPARTPFEFVARYIFAGSRFLEPYFADDTAPKLTARLAIYQFGRFAESMDRRIGGTGSERILRFLRYVRRLAWFREDKDLAQIPDAAAGLDAVRLMTVHGAKGLEFDTVFIPYLGAGKFPKNPPGGIPLPIPDSLVAGAAAYHNEEEECLYFVALSRSRDRLHLSRAERYGRSNSNGSRFLSELRDVLPPPIAPQPLPPDEPDPPTSPQVRDRFYASELERYRNCPREFYYTGVLRMKVKEDESVYKRFHAIMREALNEACAGGDGEPFACFERRWAESELAAHPYSELYVEFAREILANPDALGPSAASMEFTVCLGNAVVRVEADEVEAGAGTVTVRRLKTGRKTADPRDDRDALLYEGAKQSFPESAVEVRKLYLASNDEVRIDLTERFLDNARKRYSDAVDGIRDGRFPAEPHEGQRCPNCPHYLICPAGH